LPEQGGVVAFAVSLGNQPTRTRGAGVWSHKNS
jgi:hypothetical protein